VSYLTENRAALRRRFYWATGTAATDDALIEHDAESLEQAHYCIQHGIWRAQRFLIRHGYADGWLTQSATLSFSGSEDTNGGRYASLPADFLMLAGDDTEAVSALRQPSGTRWGRLIEDERELYNYQGDYYTIRGAGGDSAATTGKLWIARGANPPSDLVMDYHHRHAILADDSTVLNFPQDAGNLVVAEAANLARTQPWFPGDAGRKEDIKEALRAAHEDATSWARRDRKPKRLNSRPVFNNRWI
jgi:hypothetical protein